MMIIAIVMEMMMMRSGDEQGMAFMDTTARHWGRCWTLCFRTVCIKSCQRRHLHCLHHLHPPPVGNVDIIIKQLFTLWLSIPTTKHKQVWDPKQFFSRCKTKVAVSGRHDCFSERDAAELWVRRNNVAHHRWLMLRTCLVIIIHIILLWGVPYKRILHRKYFISNFGDLNDILSTLDTEEDEKVQMKCKNIGKIVKTCPWASLTLQTFSRPVDEWWIYRVMAGATSLRKGMFRQFRRQYGHLYFMSDHWMSINNLAN